MLKFSVIVPVYNVEKYLPACIESIINQTYKKLEILLVNDGSQDNCLEIMQWYARKDERIIVISQENAGLSAARNTGLSMATGDYIAFIDSDDWIEPEMFAALNLRIGSANPDFVCFRLQYDTPDSSKSRVYGKPYRMTAMDDPYQILYDALVVNNIPTSAWSKIYNRHFLLENNLQFKPGIVNEDTLFSLQTACHAKMVAFEDRIFYHVLEREGSISRSAQDRLFRDMATALEEARKYLTLHGRLEDQHIFHTFCFRYVKSMLYNICQSAQRLPYKQFNSVCAVCMTETAYKEYKKYQLKFPLRYRGLYLLSFYPWLFFPFFKFMHLLGVRMH